MFRLLIAVSLLFSISNAGPQHRLEASNISGGKITTIKSLPYQASLEHNRHHICGASIIGPDLLLTAAHCLNDADPKNYRIRVGTSFREQEGQLFVVKRFRKHNAHSLLDSYLLKFTFDFAVVWIKSKFKFDQTVQPIALPSKKDCLVVGTEGIVSGWGKTSVEGKLSKQLRSVKVSTWNHEKCQQAYSLSKIEDEEMICAGDKGKGSCVGDSGGPFVVNGKLCGIVSWGGKCGDPKLPGVYNRVTYFLDWLQLVLKS